MSLSDVRAALIQAYLAVGLDLETAFENRKFSPPANTYWIKFTSVPNTPEVATLGSTGVDRVTGFIQLDINGPMNAGEEAHLSYVDRLRNAFPAGTAVSYNSQVVKISAAGRSQGRIVEGFYRVSFTISWYAFLQR